MKKTSAHRAPYYGRNVRGRVILPLQFSRVKLRLPSPTSDVKIAANLEARLQQAASTVDGRLRVLRIIYAALLVAIVLYAWIPGGMLHIAVQPIDRKLYAGIAVIAVLSALVAVVVRNRMLQPELETLKTNPADAAALMRWRLGILVSYSLALSVVLYGFVLRMMGATFAQAAPFYAAGLALMLFWWPRRP